MGKKNRIIVLFIFVFCLFITGCKEDVIITPSEIPEEVEEITFDFVEIRGEVRFPGIYQIKKGSMINDLVKLAGGLSSNADTSSINLVSLLYNHQKVYIPKIGEKEVNSGGEENTLISINQGTLTELCEIPGIGKVTAKKIIDYRESSGPFQKLEDIMKVEGIGNETYKKIQKFICL